MHRRMCRHNWPPRRGHPETLGHLIPWLADIHNWRLEKWIRIGPSSLRSGVNTWERPTAAHSCVARSSSAMSSFFIFNMASMAFGCLTRSGRTAGKICQERPNLSFSQPH